MEVQNHGGYQSKIGLVGQSYDREEAMKDLGLYDDENEQKQHFSAMRMIVKDAESSEEEIRHLYEGVLQEFKSEAKIKTFLSILVSKKVKELLRARGR